MPPRKKSGAPPGLRRALSTLPPVQSDYILFNQPPEDWKKKPYSLKKADLLERLVRYASAQQIEGSTVKSFTIDDILTALKQVHLARPSNNRWMAEHFIANNGLSGDEFENQQPIIISDRSAEDKSDRKNSDGQQSQNSLQTSSQDSTLEQPDNSTKPEPPNPNFTPPNLPTTPEQSQAIDLGTDDEESKQPVIDETDLNVLPTTSDRFLHQKVGIAINKAMQEVFYQPLDRQNGGPKYGLSFNLVTHGDNLTKALDVRFPMKGTMIRLRTDNPGDNHTWRIDPINTYASIHLADVNDFPLRGRGPVWNDNSCAIDSCIVAGLFLDAGLTIADLSGETNVNQWISDLSEIARQFRMTICTNWQVLSNHQSIELRDGFWDTLNKSQIDNKKGKDPVKETWQKGKMLPALSVWKACTEGFGQFQYKIRKTTTACTCGHNAFEGPPILASDVPLDEVPDNPTMTDRIRHHFSKVRAKPCPSCKRLGRVHEKVILGDLPLRLAVIPPGQRRQEGGAAVSVGSVPNHTAAMRFRYRTASGYRMAAYRWLGGIYYRGAHFRTYWSDADRHRPDNGSFCVYDGMLAEGAIVGGFQSLNPEQRVHESWGNQGQVILFYERVLGQNEFSIERMSQAIADVAETSLWAIRENRKTPGSTKPPATGIQTEIRPSSSASGAAQDASRREALTDRLTGMDKAQEISTLTQQPEFSQSQSEYMKYTGSEDPADVVAFFKAKGLQPKTKACTAGLLDKLKKLLASECTLVGVSNAAASLHCSVHSDSGTPGGRINFLLRLRAKSKETKADKMEIDPENQVEGTDEPVPETSSSPVKGGGSPSSVHPHNRILLDPRALEQSNIVNRSNQGQVPPNTQPAEAQIIRQSQGVHSNDSIGECWVCEKEVQGTNFAWWQSDGQILFRHQACWRCEECKLVMDLNNSHKADTRMYKLSHTICEKGTTEPKCLMCLTDLSQFPPTSVEWAVGGFLCPACANPQVSREVVLERAKGKEAEICSWRETTALVRQEKREDARNSQYLEPETGHKRKRDGQYGGGEVSAQRCKLQSSKQERDLAEKGVFVPRYSTIPHEHDLTLRDIPDERTRNEIARISWFCPLTSIEDCHRAWKAVHAEHKNSNVDIVEQCINLISFAKVSDATTKERDISLYSADVLRAARIRALQGANPGSTYRMAGIAFDAGEWDWKAIQENMRRSMEAKRGTEKIAKEISGRMRR